MAPNTSFTAAMHYKRMQSGLASTKNMANSHVKQTPSTNAPPPINNDAAVQQRLMGHIRKRLEEKIPESGFCYKPYVFSEDDFRMKMTAYLALNDRETPLDTVDDFPTDPEIQRRLAQELVEAMLNREKHTLIDPEARLPLARIKKMSPFEIDLMAWNILFETRDVHRGKLSLPSWGKDWPWEEFSSFSERFKAVKKALYHCKAMVSSLFDEIFAKRLPLNPSAESSRKTSNKRLNGKRKRDLEIAKSAKQDGFVPSNLRKPSPESVLSTERQSSSPQRQILARQAPTTYHGLEQARAGRQFFDTDDEFFDLANIASLNTQAQQFGQDLTAGNFQYPAQNEIGGGPDGGVLTENSSSHPASILGSPFTFQAQQGRPERIGYSTTTQHCLPATNTDQWSDKSAIIGDNLNPGLFNIAQHTPSISQQWSDHTDFSKVTAVGNTAFVQGQQKPQNSVTTQFPGDAFRSANTYGQRGPIPGSTSVMPAVPQVVHQSSQQASSQQAQNVQSSKTNAERLSEDSVQNTDVLMPDAQDWNLHDFMQPWDYSSTEQGNGPQHVQGQAQPMHEDSLELGDLVDPSMDKQLEDLLNMPGHRFDPELGVWKDEQGEIIQFSNFSSD